jgi:hypothetical protein
LRKDFAKVLFIVGEKILLLRLWQKLLAVKSGKSSNSMTSQILFSLCQKSFISASLRVLNPGKQTVIIRRYLGL